MNVYKRTLVLVMALSGFAAVSNSPLAPVAYAQETTGGLGGTVKDPSGAVVPNATITATTPTLVGVKTTQTDSRGNYHFANLPPGPYTITVQVQGFDTLKRTGLMIEVGHAPTVDLTLAIGTESTTVDVSAATPQIDVTSVTTQTTLTNDVVQFIPHGLTFQSVIQFAPAASNEPLMGSTASNGSGGVSPGSATNGSPYGYSVAGGSDSENAYLVEGQETANLIGGYSKTSVPFDFIDEVQIKTSGIPAEYGGALGGIVNVVMKKGTSHYHGSVFSQYESTALDANQNNPQSRYDPASAPAATSFGALDQPWQGNQLVKPHTSLVYPGFTLGGPLVPLPGWRDKIFAFIGFNPELQRVEEFINYGPAADAIPGNVSGVVPFSQNINTYYTTARVDAQASQKVRVFASYLYQLQRENGEALPPQDSSQGNFNTATACFGAAGNCVPQGASPQFSFGHNLGYVAPNITFNTGADITLSSKIVSTTRFGYYFENYHDFGYPATGNSYQFGTAGFGEPQGYQNDPINENFTSHNASKAIQFDEAFSFFKSTSFGQHNIKVGYGLNRLSNNINQHFNNPYVELFPGTTYSPETNVGPTNCTTAGVYSGANTNQCTFAGGYATIMDYGSNGKATSYDNALFAQDSWTVGKGLTLDVGLRIEKEFLPAEAEPSANAPSKPINFGWGSKIAPRLGAAYDVFNNGKLKIFGDYSKVYDVMKLNLAISSFGGQYWQNCYYGIDSANYAYTSINPAFNSAGRYCSGPNDASTANFGGGAPAGLTFIENVNFRTFPTTCSTCSATEEGVQPNLQPYQQHQTVFGADYQISRTVSFEARYDRKRLDRAIEDSSIYNPNSGETFVIVNPGFGANGTFNSFCNFLYGAGNSSCTPATTGAEAGLSPPQQTIPAARSYDGLELRVSKAPTHGFAGMFSYTYSHFRGNYTGLTSSDLSDGDNGGRNAPNNSRAFDEPFFSYNSLGGSSSGLLPTDRPNKFKGYGYYQLKYLRNFSSDFGLFSYFYQGSPNTSFVQDVGYPASGDFPVDIFNRGKWANVSQNATTGAVTVGSPYTYRNPWFVQSDFNFTETYKIGESKAISFNSNFTNIFNEHAVTAINEQVDSNSGYLNNSQATLVNGLGVSNGYPFYAAVTHPYSIQSLLNANGPPNNATPAVSGGPQAINSAYGKPLYYQIPRTIRFSARFSF